MKIAVVLTVGRAGNDREGLELPHWQKRRYELIGPRRELVEKVFGTLKRSNCYSRMQYRGLERNAVETWFNLMVYDFRLVLAFSLGES